MIANSVAELIRDPVVLEVESIDRMYLNGYVSSLQTEGGFVHFVRGHLGYPIASTAVIAPMTETFVRAIERFAQEQRIDIVAFEKDPRKDDVAKEYLAQYPLPEGVLFIGKAQEKASVFRTPPKEGSPVGSPLPLDHAGHGATPALLLLPPGGGLRAAVHPVLFVLPLCGQGLSERARVGQAATG
jgi:hypothetical protein